ncbi:YceI family protein [Fluviicola taffensis]|uniref:YceI family protein n=1 Tax=Fluviicola taffensis TaxID=191579 RepID=UPI0031379134
MRTITYFFVAGSFILFSAFTIVTSTTWKVSDNYSVKFAGTDAEGIFKTLKGDVSFDADNLSSTKFDFTVDVNSINTGNGMKNKHAVSDKWFDADKYPKITFKSSKIVKEDGQFKVTGTMTIHGVSKEMTIPFSFKNNTIDAKFSVNRMDYKVGTMEGMSKKVSDKISLEVTIPLSK